MPADATTITIEIIRSPECGWYRAHIPGIPAYGDGETEPEALESLHLEVAGFVEVFGVAEVLGRIRR